MHFDELTKDKMFVWPIEVETAPMTVYLDTDTIEHLARFCVEHDKTPDTIVNLAVRKYLEILDEIYKVDT